MSDLSVGRPGDKEAGDTPRFLQKKFNPHDRDMYPLGFPSDPDLLRRIFDYSDVTRTIFHAARGRDPMPVHPVALLMREMVRRGRRCPVQTRLYPGTPLSLFVVDVGRSGTGKSEVAKEDASPWPGHKLPGGPTWLEQSILKGQESQDSTQENTAPPAGAAPSTAASTPAAPTTTPPSTIVSPSTIASPVLVPHAWDDDTEIGSGQALVDEFVELVGEGKTAVPVMKPHPNVLIDVDEYLTLLKAAKSDGSTMVSTLNAAWSGRSFGSRTRSHGKMRTTGPYTLFLLAGVQPRFAHEVLAHDDSGFFQRHFFCPVTDPYSDLVDADDNPLPAQPVIDPPLVTAPPWPLIKEGDMFTADPVVKKDIREAARLKNYDHLDDPAQEARSHAMQVRLRIAQLAALLHGTLHISAQLWAWTAHLMELSDRTEAWMRAEVRLAQAAAAAEEGAKRAEITASMRETKTDRTLDVVKLIINYVDSGASSFTKKQVRDRVTPSKRAWLQEALDHLVDMKYLQVDGTRYVHDPDPAPTTADPAPPSAGGGIATPGGGTERLHVVSADDENPFEQHAPGRKKAAT
jgi:hypothetical protein